MTRRGATPEAPPHPLGAQLRTLRLSCGLSQSGLARRAEIDPAYVNRIERLPVDSTLSPSRTVILALYEALLTAAEDVGARIEYDDRERLLVAAGLCPEVILRAGGWDGFRERLLRALVTDGAYGGGRHRVV